MGEYVQVAGDLLIAFTLAGLVVLVVGGIGEVVERRYWRRIDALARMLYRLRERDSADVGRWEDDGGAP